MELAVGGDTAREALVFSTDEGKPLDDNNVRRMMASARRHADKALAKAKAGPLAAKLGPHAMRRTFASVLCAMDEDYRYIMGQLGQTDGKFTINTYARAMERRTASLSG